MQAMVSNHVYCAGSLSGGLKILGKVSALPQRDEKERLENREGNANLPRC